ncbi:uncharacterized protein M6B38_277445 [Iris pallida]|uniref:Transmembrane protein n=1 Tax=Iris pallida TaxID=29817 RepID=A0AAX6I3W2_IRIPA|nr:uncharacterized protein M6B38_161610 [Iris pallida]KAJ6847593.1 uncharacterized protein M6B38_277445 [Iris pallida]
MIPYINPFYGCWPPMGLDHLKHGQASLVVKTIVRIFLVVLSSGIYNIVKIGDRMEDLGSLFPID